MWQSSLRLLESSFGEGVFSVKLMNSSSIGLDTGLFLDRLLSPVGVRGVEGRMALIADSFGSGVLTGCSSSEYE